MHWLYALKMCFIWLWIRQALSVSACKYVLKCVIVSGKVIDACCAGNVTWSLSSIVLLFDVRIVGTFYVLLLLSCCWTMYKKGDFISFYQAKNSLFRVKTIQSEFQTLKSCSDREGWVYVMISTFEFWLPFMSYFVKIWKGVF